MEPVLKAVLHPVWAAGRVWDRTRTFLLERGFADPPFWRKAARELGLKDPAVRVWRREAAVLEAALDRRWADVSGWQHSGCLEASCREVLYVVVRALRPLAVVETGVANGASSCFLLSALKANGKGRLWSIEMPGRNFHTPPGKDVGWLVPGELREGWTLLRQDSLKALPPLLAERGSIDVFIHDSLHTQEMMTREYELAWPRLRQGGLLASDDVNFNAAFAEFASRVGGRPLVWRTRLGFIVKGPPLGRG